MDQDDFDLEDEKRERVLILTDTVYKILCMADNKNYDPSVGADNLAMMYSSLAGPLDFEQFEIERAKRKAKFLNLTPEKSNLS